MGLRVPDRVHITPVGHEYVRVVESAEELRADKVVLINHANNDKYGSDCWNEVVRAFDNSGIEYETKECDIFDLYESLGTISRQIAEHQDEEVYVNVSTGSKITAIAGMIASMVMECTAYYTKVDSYPNPESSHNRPQDINNIVELPPYSIDSPDTEQVKIMDFVHRKTNFDGPPTKGDLIFFSDYEQLPFMQENVAGKGKYRLLDNNIIEPLESRDYITVSKHGRSKVITLTDNGRAALEAFRWLQEDDTNWNEIFDQLSSDE